MPPYSETDLACMSNHIFTVVIAPAISQGSVDNITSNLAARTPREALELVLSKSTVRALGARVGCSLIAVVLCNDPSIKTWSVPVTVKTETIVRLSIPN